MNQGEKATGPRIVVLSPSLQVLHMNRRAMALLNQLAHTARAVDAPLHQHYQDIMEPLQARLDRTAGNNSSKPAQSAIHPT